jgi:uncharacterized membrane protein YukC
MPSFTFYVQAVNVPLIKTLQTIQDEKRLSEFVVETLETRVNETIQQRIREHESKVEFWKNVAAGMQEDERRRAGEEEAEAAASIEEQEKEDRELEELAEQAKKELGLK